MAAKETPQRSGFSVATRAAPFREPPFLWVEFARDPSLLFHGLRDLYPGHRISGHEDLRLAIEKLSPSFICFEHDHPGGDGIRLLAETSARYPHAPLVMLTNDHAKETMVLAYRSGASSYVVKPIALHELVREIRILLALGRDHAQFPAPRQQGYRPNLKAPALEDRTTPCREPPRRSSVSNRASPKTFASRI
jgi:DNA-binding NarL/FixJ family response regulator